MSGSRNAPVSGALLLSLLPVVMIGLAPDAEAQGITITAATPASRDLDPALLAQAATNAEKVPALTSLLVWRRGALVHEGYHHGGSRDAPVNVKSVSKSFLSALVGIAVAGRADGVDQRVAEILPDYYGPTTGALFADLRVRSDSLRQKITLRHLLTMSGGLGWDEGNVLLTYALLSSHNPVRFAAELPVLTPPGSGFNYSTASSHLLAGALARLTGESNRDFAQRQLLGPAGIVLSRWDADASGVHFGGSEMFLTPREMMKLGLLYLHRGKVGDRQIIPADWIAESTRKHYDVTAQTYRQMIPGLTGYGYSWWLRTAGGHEMVGALGLGGQFVLIVPSLDMVIAGTSALDERNPGNEKQFTAIFEIVDRQIIAAAR